MDAKLLHAVRTRMESSPTEDLLRLWTDNDREHYAEEAFEAARLILIDRGVAPPKQRDWTGRAPLATTVKSLDPASKAFWNLRLRPLLWGVFAVGAVRCLYLAV